MNTQTYAKERLCYILEETFHYLITILISGSYLAKITSSLGFSDGLTAILSAFVTLGCSFQLLSVVFFRKGMVKRRLTAVFLLNQLLFMLLYLIPSFSGLQGLRTVLFIVLLFLGHFIVNIALAPRTNWFMSFVDNGKRGIFTAKKEAISLISGMLFQFLMSAVIDRFEAQGDIHTAFTLCAIVIFVLSIGHALSLICTQDQEVTATHQSLSEEIKDIFTDKGFRPLLGLCILWAICHNVSIPFYGTYTIKELGFIMTFLAFLSLLTAVSRILASIWLGKYADRYSFAKMLRLCYCILAIGFAVAVFIRPSNGYVLYPVYAICNAVSLGGINSAEINLIFDYISPKKRTVALSVRMAVYGIIGFLTSTVATPLLHSIQNAGNRLLFMHIYAQQVLSAIALVFTILLTLYVHRLSKKLRVVDE